MRTSLPHLFLPAALAAALAAEGAQAQEAPPAATGPRLLAGVKILDGDEPINVEVGHAAPLVIDWDGDGKRDLLVGQFGDGKLRFYRSVAEDAKATPRFKGFEYVRAGGGEAKIPSG